MYYINNETLLEKLARLKSPDRYYRRDELHNSRGSKYTAYKDSLPTFRKDYLDESKKWGLPNLKSKLDYKPDYNSINPVGSFGVYNKEKANIRERELSRPIKTLSDIKRRSSDLNLEQPESRSLAVHKIVSGVADLKNQQKTEPSKEQNIDKALDTPTKTELPKEQNIDKALDAPTKTESPKEKSHLGRNLAIGAGVLGAGALGTYLWRRHKKKQALQKKAMELLNIY